MQNRQKKVEILGVPIDSVTTDEALEAIANFMNGTGGKKVFTPNPEMLVLARKDKRFREALNNADLAIPDGIGLLWVARLWGKSLKARVTGTDTMIGTCALAEEYGKSVFLLGGKPGVAEKAADKLRARYPNLRIAGTLSGGDISFDDDGVPMLEFGTENVIAKAEPDILFVAFGHGKQEKWIDAHLAGFKSVKVAMGIGGAFDFISGEAKRAPEWVRHIGLEWLWRLILQPWRIRRILTATVVFPLYALGERIGIIKTDK
jgi:N-acetylglucosaminyldiphosphoundecaprenol N-acetyl-beta-D-mannosaminyltransferase